MNILSPLSKYLLVFFLFSLSNLGTIKAQDEFISGFVISNENDTIQGLLKEQLSPEGYDILVKKSGQSQATKYSPQEIKQYYLSTGELFETHSILVNNTPTKVFFKCQIKGEVSFYTYFDISLVDRFYIHSKENGIRELILTKKKKYNKSARTAYLHSQNQYIGELMYLLQDCSTIRAAAEKTKLSTKSIKALFLNYYNCTGKSFTKYRSTKSKPSKKWDVEAGLLGGWNVRLRTEFNPGTSRGGYNISPFAILYIPQSRQRYAFEIRYTYAAIGLENEQIKVHKIPLRINRYFQKSNSPHRLSTKIGFNVPVKNAIENGFVVGLGYDLKLGKTRLVSNFEYRFILTKILNFNIGFSF